ncbi:MAG: methyl-accepting chemotaxis protein [Desulfococcaceae bacterium]
MRFSLTIGRKIGLGFALVLLPTLATGGAGYLAMTRALEGASLFSRLGDVRADFWAAVAGTERHLGHAYAEGRDLQRESAAAVRSRLERCDENLAAMAFSGLEAAREGAEAEVEGYRASFDAYDSAERQKIALASEIEERLAALGGAIRRGEFMIEDLQNAHALLRASAAAYFERSSPVRYGTLQRALNGLDRAAAEWHELVRGSDAHREVAERVSALARALSRDTAAYYDHALRQNAAILLMNGHRDALETAVAELSETARGRLRAIRRGALFRLAGFVLAALAGGIGFAVWVTRSTVRRVRSAVGRVGQGARQTRGAAGQIAEASQELAEGAAAQASALEQTAAATESLTERTRRNLEISAEVVSRVKSMGDRFREVGEAGRRMGETMEELSDSSRRMALILETIDDIAFQTNLLALNAAVEAARAGQSGAGFAVVAGEVRRLARDCAAASGETGEIIDAAAERIRRSADQAESLRVLVRELSAEGAEVGGRIEEISEYSREQAVGLDQINAAISEVNRLTSAAAANAEELAAATTELDTQAEAMGDSVAGLARMIGRVGRVDRRGGVKRIAGVVEAPAVSEEGRR